MTLLSPWQSGKLVHTSMQDERENEHSYVMQKGTKTKTEAALILEMLIFDGFGGSGLHGNVYDAAGVV